MKHHISVNEKVCFILRFTSYFYLLPGGVTGCSTLLVINKTNIKRPLT